MATRELGRRWLRIVLLVATWTVIGLFFSIQQFLLFAQILGRKTTWWQAISLSLPEWYLWAVLAPAAFWLAKRFPFERDHWLRAVAVHGPAGVALSTLHVFLASVYVVYGLPWLFGPPPEPRLLARQFMHGMMSSFHWNVLIYFALVALCHARDFYDRYRERDSRALELESRLAVARLQALRMQLQPHFLFNALNAIAELIHESPDTAEAMVLRLAELLRMALRADNAQEIPLARELEFVRQYLEIEQMRFGDRLQIDLVIDPVTPKALVPAFALQPLVENAVRHGIYPKVGAGRIEIRTSRDGECLRVEVTDDGSGLPKLEPLRDGLGLGNTRARLAQLYGPSGRLNLESLAAGGLKVTLEVPFRLADGDSNPRTPTLAHSHSDRGR
jgi:signal transduction histidine kinase